ncbi:unnamed protein product [Phaedon cochleariae]|uniref:DNA-(apurinic or apyrimidinic site) endonuclease n=1 Tax=Phaedon cochleariae TaxID=80249 RepID=A0A9N9S8N4_PHACE|nr:unnamed protein product [Phaedon cochleariae]
MPPKRQRQRTTPAAPVAVSADKDGETTTAETRPKRQKKVDKVDIEEEIQLEEVTQKKASSSSIKQKTKDSKKETGEKKAKKKDTASKTNEEDAEETRPKRQKKSTKIDDHDEEIQLEKPKGKKASSKSKSDAKKEEVIEAIDDEEIAPGITKRRQKKAPIDYVEESDEGQPAKKVQKKASKKTNATKSVKAKSTNGEVAPVAAKRQKEAPVETVESSDVGQPEEKVPKKASKSKTTKSAKAKATNGEEKGKGEEPKVAANKTITDWGSIEYTCSKKNGEDKPHNLIISCWNVGGLKSWVAKGCLEYLEHEKPDIFCMQETKCSEEKLPDQIKDIKLYKQYWCSSKKEGYAGVGLFTIKEPISVTYGIEEPEIDEEGRCITAEYDQFYLVCVYVPNAGRKLVTLPKRLDWNSAFKGYVNRLEARKPVIICGDMNVSHQEIDLARPASNKKNAGFTQEERDGMTDFLGEGYVDTFRELYPDKADAYTFWTYMANARAKNVGWRLDYFIISKKIMQKVCDNVIRSEIVGSDHCPITLFININAEGPRAITK